MKSDIRPLSNQDPDSPNFRPEKDFVEENEEKKRKKFSEKKEKRQTVKKSKSKEKKQKFFKDKERKECYETAGGYLHEDLIIPCSSRPMPMEGIEECVKECLME